MNTFTQALADTLAARGTHETWLLAPNGRVGRQWLDRLALSGQPVFNVRTLTLRHAAISLALPLLEAQGKTLLRGQAFDLLVHRALATVCEKGATYLSRLLFGTGLTRALSRVVLDLRMAGVDPSAMHQDDFEVSVKGQELARLLAAYETAMAAENYVDFAAVLESATARLAQAETALPAGIVVVYPANLAQVESEKNFLRAIPESRRFALPVDSPDTPPAADEPDRALLRCLTNPTSAPAAKDDHTLQIFQAYGETNEIREVLRRCAREKIPLDTVEILHTDSEAYVTAAYEISCRWQGRQQAQELAAASNDSDSGLFTFAEGIPCHYSRPGRALMAWVEWRDANYSQTLLVRMLQDGLLRLSAQAEEPTEANAELVGHAYVAKVLRSLPIGEGREGYATTIQDELAALQYRAATDAEEEEPNLKDEGGGKSKFRHAALLILLRLTNDLFAEQPDENARAADVLTAALSFLENQTQAVNQLDTYAAQALEGSVKELLDALTLNDDADECLPGLDEWDWLRALPGETTIQGQGSRPGRAHLAPLRDGGHTGRAHTFIVGLDEARFPGAGLQDPLILDAERESIAKRSDRSLPTSRGQSEEKLAQFRLLLARLRGTVTLSYSCRNLAADHDAYPSTLLLTAWQILTGRTDASQADFLAAFTAASFAPTEAEACLGADEWWLWRLTEPDNLTATTALGGAYPHLARGFAARAARASADFTEYDGYVPAAGAAHDPTAPEGVVLSAGRLEKLGKCPLDYFFKYILKITPSEDAEVDEDAWLDALARGSLLHRIFHRFVLEKGTARPDKEKDWPKLLAILHEEAAKIAQEYPPPNEQVRTIEMHELEEVAQIFLAGEVAASESRVPFALEASVGMRGHDEASPLDVDEPLRIALPSGGEIQVRGRVDRVDQYRNAADEYAIWDYKTGSAGSYKQNNPFNQGRRVQNILYKIMVEQRLRELGKKNAKVVEVGYYFPTAKAWGRRVSWSEDDLQAGEEIIEDLCELLKQGVFPVSDSATDVTYSDYLSAFGDPDLAAAQITAKLGNPENGMLAAFNRLRAEPEKKGKNKDEGEAASNRLLHK